MNRSGLKNTAVDKSFHFWIIERKKKSSMIVRGYWFINEVFPTLKKQPNLQRQQELHHQTKSKNTENKNKNQKKHIPTISKNNNLKQVPSLRVDRQVHFLLLSFFKFTEETKKWEILKFQRRKRRTMKMIRKAKAVIIWRWVGDLESS